MKFFIVNNGSALLDNIVHRITDAGHDYCIQEYSPFEVLDPKDADIIILSGGMQNEVADDLANGVPWYRHEFDLIQNTNKPIFGICLGLQMINVALGGTLKKLETLVESDSKKVTLMEDGKDLLGTSHLSVHEKHQWTVDRIADGLVLLGHSEDGIELLYDPKRSIVGAQFHPEKDVNDESKQLFWSLIDLVAQPVGVGHEK